MITAIVFVNADVARIPEVAEQIASLPGVTEVYSVTGALDLIAALKPDEKASFRLRRERSSIEIPVKIGKRPTLKRQ